MTRALFVGNFLSAHSGHRHYCEELTDRLEAASVTIVRTSERLGRIARLLDMGRTAWFRRGDYDVALVDVFSGPAFCWAEFICAELAALSKPFALTLRGGQLPEFARKWPRRVSRLLESARIVTSPSRYLAVELSGLRPDIEVIPNALDLSAYPFVQRQAAAPRLVWLRAFHDIYNPALAVEVLRRVRESYPNATLVMVGADKDGSIEQVRQLIEHHGLTQSVQITPGVKKAEVPAYLAKGDIYINTARIDNTPISVLEAMACGLCVVSTNVGGIAALLDDGKDALLVSSDEPAAMARAVERLLAQPELASSLSRHARSTVSNFDWAPVLGTWKTVLVRLAHA